MPNPNAGYQEELFREFSQGSAQRKGTFSKQALFSSKMVSFEQILFTAIGGLIAIVVAFSLGVEKGKSITRAYENPVAETRMVPEEVKEVTLRPKEIELPPVIITPKQNKEASTPKSEPKGYTIQVASYKDKKSVERLIGEFHSKGQKSFSLPKGELLIVCVGNYQNPTEASKASKVLKKYFPDCFVRKL